MSNSYWDNFYLSQKKNASLREPSQFAIFVYGETHEISQMIEFGSGNGRDAFFFGSHGKNVLALDASEAATNSNNDFATENLFHDSIKFQKFEIGKDDYSDLQICEEKKFLYARFFLHSLNNDLLQEFSNIASKIMKIGEKLYVEYRTNQDEKRNKVFDGHYRNYIDPNVLIDLLKDFDLALEYSVQGLGYAKYKEDDAFVSRMIFQKV